MGRVLRDPSLAGELAWGEGSGGSGRGKFSATVFNETVLLDNVVCIPISGVGLYACNLFGVKQGYVSTLESEKEFSG